MRGRIDRREFVATGALGSLSLWLAACGGGDDGGGGGGGRDFRFTDDRGETVRLDGQPKRIVAHEYALAALWDYGVRPVGVYGSVPHDEQPLFADLDLGELESVGEVWGEVNLEALAALRPDLIVTTYWPSEKLLGGIKDSKLEERMSAIAPIVGIHAQVPAATTIEHFEKLAAALGRDVDSGRMDAIRSHYRRARERLRRAIAEKPGLRVMAVYADPEAFYVAKPEDYSDLREYRSWGLNLVAGKSSKPYWEQLSWENADKYEADLILHDARAHAPTPEQLEEVAAWQRLPAVRAGQLSPWHMEEAVSYRLFADHIEELAERIERSEVIRSD